MKDEMPKPPPPSSNLRRESLNGIDDFIRDGKQALSEFKSIKFTDLNYKRLAICLSAILILGVIIYDRYLAFKIIATLFTIFMSIWLIAVAIVGLIFLIGWIFNKD